MNQPRRTHGGRLWWAPILALLFPLVYVLSYAPVVMALGGWTTEKVPNFNGRVYPIKVPLCGRSLPLYRPADWLIDNTPLDEPMRQWADLWGVRDVFAESVMWR